MHALRALGLGLLFAGLSAPCWAKAGDRVEYGQQITACGLVIKAPSSVKSKALSRAKEIVEEMLRARPDIAERMVRNRAQLAIIPKDSFISALPEFAQGAGRQDPNGNRYDSFAVRGAGGIPSQPVTATSEENLLELKGDPFWQECITRHEFAHAIMNLGFSEAEKKEWAAIYAEAAKKETFPGSFAMKNADEYWAELSQSYFSRNNEINEPKTIRKGDKAAFEFLRRIYDPRVSQQASAK